MQGKGEITVIQMFQVDVEFIDDVVLHDPCGVFRGVSPSLAVI